MMTFLAAIINTIGALVALYFVSVRDQPLIAGGVLGVSGYIIYLCGIIVGGKAALAMKE